jgi:hypothetical protein
MLTAISIWGDLAVARPIGIPFTGAFKGEHPDAVSACEVAFLSHRAQTSRAVSRYPRTRVSWTNSPGGPVSFSRALLLTLQDVSIPLDIGSG